MKYTFLIVLTVMLGSVVSTNAQVASNPPFVLEQAVIASGGTANSADGEFKLDVTIGEAVAGASTASPISLRSGFLNGAPPVSNIVAGRVLTLSGGGLKSARVILTGADGKVYSAVTGASGFYRLTGVPAGQSYVVSVESRRYRFAEQTVFVDKTINDLDLAAQSAR